MSASTVRAVRARLIELLRVELKAIGDTLTEVTYGHPGRSLPARFIAVCDTDEAGVARNQVTFPLGRDRSRSEDYRLRVVIWRLVGDHDDQVTPTVETWALVDLLDDLLRKNPHLKAPDGSDELVTHALCDAFNDLDALLAEGRASEVVVSVRVHVNRI